MKTNEKTLKRKLDDIFSTFIRLRDSDVHGNITCVSCKKNVPWKESHNCHYADRKHMATRWDEINCNAGCAKCNAFDQSFHIHEYGKFLNEKHGTGTDDRIMALSRTTIKFSLFEIQEKINYYKLQIKQYENN